jgi:HK97 gp10 family phage protein
LSIQFRVELNGFEDFAAKMRTLDEATQDCVQDALNQTAQMVAIRAQELAPVRTGRLMSNIFPQVIYRWVVRVICRVPYAIFQELGTRYIAPRFFLTRALSEYASQFMFIVSAALQRAAEEASAE